MRNFEYYTSLKQTDGSPSFNGALLNIISQGLAANLSVQHPRCNLSKRRRKPLDVSKFTILNKDGTPVFNYYQMEAIYNGLNFGLDVTLCTTLDKQGCPVYSYYEMNRMLDILANQGSASDYLERVKKENEWLVKELLTLDKEKKMLFYSFENQKDHFNYPNFNHDQLKEILIGIRYGVDIVHYAHSCVNNRDMLDVREALMLGADPAALINSQGIMVLDLFSIDLVKQGLRAGVNTSIFAGGEGSPRYSYEQTKEILNGLLSGVDTSLLTVVGQNNEPIHSAETMRQLRFTLESERANRDKAELLHKAVIILTILLLIAIYN